MNFFGRTWTQEECEVLREDYGSTDRNTLAQRLGRTPEAVYQRAVRLGIAKASYKVWGREDDDYLLANWGKIGKCQIAKDLNANHKTVISHAARLGLPAKPAQKIERVKKDEGKPIQVVKLIRPENVTKIPVYETLPIRHNPFHMIGN